VDFEVDEEECELPGKIVGEVILPEGDRSG
jgi:hypothetical protein